MLERTPFDFDATSRWTALADGPENVSLWRDLTDADLREPTGTVETRRSRIVGLALVDAERMITVHDLGEIVGWSLPTDSEESDATVLWECDTPLEPCAVAAHRQGRCRVVVGGRRGRILVLSPTREPGDPPFARLNRAHRTDIVSFAFSGDGRRLASSGRDRRIGLWNIEPTGENLLTDIPFDRATGQLSADAIWLGSAGWPLSMVFEPDGRRLVSGAMDNGVYLWDDAGESPLAAVRHRHGNWVADVDWSEDGKMVASAGWDASVVLYDGEDLEPEHLLDAHSDIVTTVQFQPGSSLLVTAGYDGKVGIWNWRDKTLEHWIDAHSTWIEHVVPDSKGGILTVSSAGTIGRWSLQTGESLGTMGDKSEGFQLGRAVDFSEYLDIDEPSDPSNRGSEPDLPETHFRAIEADSSANEAERSAVGLLEAAAAPPADIDGLGREEDEPSPPADTAPDDALAPSTGDPVEDADIEPDSPDPERVVDDLNLRDQAPDTDAVAAADDDSATRVPDLDLAGLKEADAGPDLDRSIDEDLEIAGTERPESIEDDEES
jgi:WD40 repeat protein